MRWLIVCCALVGAAFFLWNRGPDTRDWMDRVVDREFARYERRGISQELIDETWVHAKTRPEFRRYKIIDSKVYGPPGRIRNLLEVLVETYPVPDVDFIYFYEDRLKRTFFRREGFRNGAPVFVSAKHKKIDRVILFSDWVYDIKDQQKGWNFLIRTMNEHHDECPWSEKTEKLFWRGTPWDGKHFDMYTFENWTQIPRGHLVHESLQHPELIDAGFSEYPFSCKKQDPARCEREMGKISFLSWSDVLRYKYHLAIDGVTCSFPATQWKLLSGCLTFKQDSDDIMYFYGEMKPWVHYVPVKNDLSDLQEKIQWARSHDGEAKAISENARQFALDHLMPEQILLYCYKTLVKYASLQTFQPKVEE